MGKKRSICNIFLGNLEVREHLEEKDIDESVLKLDLKQVWCMGLNCTQLAQDRDQRQVFVNTVLNPNLI